jgi:Raf kinase inhibitor-like YbhB/YbcL family protein
MKNKFGITVFTIGAFCMLTCNLHAADFALKSSVVKPGEALGSAQVFNGFGCSGKNISPDLEWSNPPPETKSYAITMYDPDAPTGSGWWHWVVFNIPPHVNKLPSNAGIPSSKLLPKNVIQSKTDFGKEGYGGPCPPEGDKPHRYYIRIYALKDRLPLNASTPAAQVGYYINKNKLAEAEIMGTYQR